MPKDPALLMDRILKLYHEIDLHGMNIVNSLMMTCLQNGIKFDIKFMDYVQEYMEIEEELHTMAKDNSFKYTI